MMVNNELERVWKETVIVALLRYCLGIYLEGLRKATKTRHLPDTSKKHYRFRGFKNGSVL
jgi:hypothetical protein